MFKSLTTIACILGLCLVLTLGAGCTANAERSGENHSEKEGHESSSELPKPVKEVLMKFAAAGKVTAIKKQMKEHGNAAYIADIKIGKSEFAITLDPSGKILYVKAEESTGITKGRGEHARDEEGGGEGEESGTEYRLIDTYDQVRNGARLILAYDAKSNSFKGTVENTTKKTLERVRVEVHLSNGIELGPTTPTSLAPGKKIEVKLAASEKSFEGWSAHPEVGNEESHGEGHGKEGSEGKGEHGSRESSEHDSREGRGEHK